MSLRLHGSQDFSLVTVSIVEVCSQFLVAGQGSTASFDTVANMRAGELSHRGGWYRDGPWFLVSIPLKDGENCTNCRVFQTFRSQQKSHDKHMFLDVPSFGSLPVISTNMI